jgi:small-conductance mechanosensitive channel
MTLVAGRVMATACLAVLLSLLVAGAAVAQSQDPSELAQSWDRRIAAAETALKADFADADPAEVKTGLQQILREVQQVRSDAQARLATLQQRMDSLGAPPAEGEPPEDESITRLRKELAADIAQQNALVTRANLSENAAESLLSRISQWEQERFQALILERSPPPISVETWRQAADAGQQLLMEFLTVPREWWQSRQQREGIAPALIWFGVVTVVGIAVGWPLRRWIMARYGRDPDDDDPTYARRIVAAFADGLANALIPAAIIAIALLVLFIQGLMQGRFGTFVAAIAVAGGALLLLLGISRASLSPHQVAWRIVPISPHYPLGLLRAIRAVAIAMAVTMAVMFLAWTSGLATPAFESVFFLIQSTVVGLLTAWLLSPRNWSISVEVSQAAQEAEAAPPDPSEAGRLHRHLDRLRAGLRVAFCVSPLIALAGYGRAAYFLQSRLLATMALTGLFLLLRMAAREILERVLQTRLGRGVDGDGGSVNIAFFWCALAVDVLLAAPFAFLVMLLYGVPTTTLTLWAGQLLSGIQIGNFTLSLGNLLAAVVVLLVGVFLTNVVRRWLTRRVLPNTRLDSGARNSVAAGTSYIGVGLALLFAVSALGLDFSNLALVAGALSLGIGFGLQNVVQNFAAGVLLLIERPVKVGDWIVVGATEGTVKRISVRSTEIETFNRQSVIVPNSDLISLPVTNWTHKNRLARVIISVRAAYGSDTERVADILLRCARDNRHVIDDPAPMALLLGFGESSLNFELRGFVADTDYYLDVISDLHFAIERAFREAGIEIPFPQRDLHFRESLRLPAADEGGRGDSGAGGGEAPHASN